VDGGFDPVPILILFGFALLLFAGLIILGRGRR
jgi:hypothetical protein